MIVQFTLNGKEAEADIRPDAILLDVLRELG